MRTRAELWWVIVLVALASASAHGDRRRTGSAASVQEPQANEPERAWAVGVPADRQAKALQIFEAGNALFEESHHAEALAKYREAIELWNHPAIRYNMAVCLIHLDQPLSAYENLTQALKYGAAPLEPQTYAQALTYKKLLEGQLARLKVVCDQHDAQVTLDGEKLFEAPGQASRLLVPGAHQLVATLAGHLTESRALTLLPGRETVETLRLTPLKALATRRRWPVWQPWVVMAAGAAVALVGVPLVLQAKSDYESYDRAVAATPACQMSCLPSDLPGPVQDLKPRAAAEDAAGIAAFAVGGAIVASGVVLLILNQPRLVERPATRVSLAPVLGPQAAGLSLGGTF
jgi:hypothetical protein